MGSSQIGQLTTRQFPKSLSLFLQISQVIFTYQRHHTLYLRLATASQQGWNIAHLQQWRNFTPSEWHSFVLVKKESTQE